MSIARIALDCPVDSLFDYRVAGASLAVGQLVVVPFGRRRQVGMVVGLAESSEIAGSRLRNVERAVPAAALPDDFMTLVRFAAEYYQCPIGQAAFASLPTSLTRLRYAGRKSHWHYVLTMEGRALDAAQFAPRAIVMRRLLKAFLHNTALDREQIQAISPRAMKLVDAWIEAGWVARVESERPRQAPTHGARSTPPELTGEQRNAVDSILAGRKGFAPWLLEGITGSGKTEVYFRLIEQAAAAGRQVLLLVPEIGLTPQLEQRVRDRFPQLAFVSLHSGLAEGERGENWLAAASGDADVVIGTRLAVFTPMPRLGLIVVDEEQDASFKQQDGLRYSARDLAIYRAQLREIPVVLGSATPSLESFHNARSGRFGHLHLRERPAATRAQIHVLDVGGRRMAQGLSEEALRAIEARQARGEQSLVFLNRRGFAPALVCSDCGWSAQCTRCSARLVWHLGDAVLRCHYCGHEERLPRLCPSCGNQDLKGLGQGTQKLEQALAASFPHARILRIDRDSTRRKHAWRAMQDDIRNDKVDILVGTQMLAKGHDFPKLTLVVIVNPDNALFSADFRAGERLFQQLMQVSGRAGRAGLPGTVLVQTSFPDHPLYRALARQDFPAFAAELLDERKRAGFPPFIYQALLRAESKSEAQTMGFLARAAAAAGGADAEVTLYDPVPAAVARVAGHHRGHLLVQSTTRAGLQDFLTGWRASLARTRASSVRWSIDVDPIEL